VHQVSHVLQACVLQIHQLLLLEESCQDLALHLQLRLVHMGRPRRLAVALVHHILLDVAEGDTLHLVGDHTVLVVVVHCCTAHVVVHYHTEAAGEHHIQVRHRKENDLGEARCHK
jgi:hypothetical protein